MNSTYRPDYGLALSGTHPAGTVEICPLILEDVGRVDEATYTLSGQVLHEGEWHLASIDFDSHLLPQLLAAIPPEAATALGPALRTPWHSPVLEKLQQPASLRVVAMLGEPQSNGQESFIPFVGVEFTAGPAVVLEVDSITPPSARVDLGQEVVVFQVEPSFGSDSGLGAIGTAAGVFLATFAASYETKKRRTPWTCFLAEHAHFSGLTLWLGVTSKIESHLLDTFQANLESMGTEVRREMSTASHLKMLPIAQIGPDGAALLHPPASTPPPSHALAALRAATGVEIEARPYVLR